MNQDNKSWACLIIGIVIFPISVSIIHLGYLYEGGLFFLIGEPIVLLLGINYERPIKREVKE